MSRVSACRSSSCTAAVRDQKDWKTVAFKQFQFFDPTSSGHRFLYLTNPREILSSAALCAAAKPSSAVLQEFLLHGDVDSVMMKAFRSASATYHAVAASH
jgi:hypothetical protein